MNSDDHVLAPLPERAARQAGVFERFARGTVAAALQGIDDGMLIFHEREECMVFGTEGCELQATVRVHDPAFWTMTAFGGTIGAAEAYLRRMWDCDDLTALIRIMVRSQNSQRRMESGNARVAALVQRILHQLNDNTRGGSRRNIAAHYDLGNDFYQLFLDPTMAYSCGIFEKSNSSMEAASIAKFDHICRALELTEGMRLLEIGTGWGSFAIHAARNYGCRVTTTTISAEQHALARQRVREAGLEGRITLLAKDYRDLTGEYDRLVSIEMIEAVGHRRLPSFFRVCSDRLKPDGLALIQAICVPDRIYGNYLRHPDFINRYIFPGGCCPSPGALAAAAAGHTDLRLLRQEDFSSHYARTLREWRKAFNNHLSDVRALGFDERFIRMWDYYLCYCEGGFVEEFTTLLQLLYAKPGYRSGSTRGGAR